MNLLIGKEEVINVSEEELEKGLMSSGPKGKTYRVGDKVLKIYSDCNVPGRIGGSEVLGVVGIPTKRTLLPEGIIRDSDTLNFMGVFREFIPDTWSIDAIPYVSMKHFLDELELLETDMKTLADNHVFVDDLVSENALYNGKLYVCDSGRFSLRRDSKAGMIFESNIGQLNGFVLDELFHLVPLDDGKRGEFNAQFDRTQNLSSQMRKDVLPGESVKQYIIRKVS